jgi:adenosylcobinamide kinase/adenosylcobinamide-phosphate guanylyltransferase
MYRITLITGGSRSGKSKHALERSATYLNKGFVATAEATDDEMRARIERHRRERDPSYFTIEEPVDLETALRSLPEVTEVAVVDCVTVWLGNLLHKERIEGETCPEIEAFLDMLESPPCDLILVTNEVGMGLIPADPASRRFRDIAGSINQELAKRAHEVVLTVSGVPVKIK